MKAALIDMDGVLYDSMPGHTLAWHRMMRELGVGCTREEFYLYEGMTGVATINLLMRRTFGHECDAARAHELYEIKSRYFREMGEAPLMPGADRMLRALKTAGLEPVLVTGSGQRSLLDKLDRDYAGCFGPTMRVTAHDVTNGKPDPEPYLMGACKAGVNSDEAIVIENAPLGVRAGKAAGCFTIAVTTGPIPRKAFEKEGADLIFDSMNEFADFLEREITAAKIRKAVEKLNPDKVFLLTDSNVDKLYDLKFPFVTSKITIPAGEKSKDLTTLADICARLVKQGATRRSVLVNVGGGVVSDIGGFAASIFKRGMHYINVPTTILAAADAAIGGKTAIDFMGLKNELGVFAMPEEVILMPWWFDTLPESEVLSGFAEVVKMALLANKNLYYKLIEEDAPADKALMAEAVAFAARTKEEIVALDPREKGLRRILNLGHTAGHAYESLAAELGCPISHGEAVAHGLLATLEKSAETVGFPREEIERYRKNILERYYKPLPFRLDHSEEGMANRQRLAKLMSHDKKNDGSGEPRFVLLEDVGKPI